ncbi:hypothetical protein P7C70_g6745, partial [Phenoliferia sp. Uapishka_3]
MDPSSDNDIEIVTLPASRHSSFSRSNSQQLPFASTSASLNAFNRGSNSPGGSSQRSNSQSQHQGLTRSLSNVIEIGSDDSSDEELVIVESRAGSMNRTTSLPAASPSSDDLPDLRLAPKSAARANGQTEAQGWDSRGRSSSALDSNTNNFPEAAFARKATNSGAGAKDKGKGRALVPPDSDEEDPYDAMRARGAQVARRKRPLGAVSSDGLDGDASGKSKGKGKAPAVLVDDEEDPYDAMKARGAQVVRRKRPKGINSDGSDGDAGKKSPPKKKVARPSQESQDAKEEKKARLAAEKAAKLEAAEVKKKLQKINNLQNDRKIIVAEIIIHVAGTAFRAPPEDSDDAEPKTAAEKKKEAARKKEADNWVKVTEDLKQRVEENGSRMLKDGMGNDYGCVGAVRWTRKCNKIWSDEEGQYVPIDGPPIVVEEDARLLFMPATELANLVEEGRLLSHIEFLKRRIPEGVNLFLMISGLVALDAKDKAVDAAAYREAVRDVHVIPAAGRKHDGTKRLKDKIDLEIMRVQVATKCFIIKVEKAEEATDWLEQLSMDVAAKPYQYVQLRPAVVFHFLICSVPYLRRLKNKHIGELGLSDEKITSGKDLPDTFVKMLSAIKGVTEPNARSIVSEYSTVRDLYDAWDACASEKERKGMLVGISVSNHFARLAQSCLKVYRLLMKYPVYTTQKGSNLNGLTSHRRIGDAISENIYKILNSPDEGMFL